MKKLSLFMLFAIVFALTACGGGGGGGGATNSGGGVTTSQSVASKLNVQLTSINGLFIAPSGSTFASNEHVSPNFLNKTWEKIIQDLLPFKSAFAQTTSKSLYSLNADNSITELLVSVTITTDPKTGITTETKNTTNTNVSANGLNDSPNFVLISYTGLYKDGKECSIVLVRKSDGKLFCLDVMPNGYSEYWEKIQSNSNGNIFFISSSNGLYKVDLTDANNPVKTALITRASDNAVIYDMAVNAAGDAFVNVSINGNTSNSWRVYKAEGGFQNISSKPPPLCITNGIGAEANNFYFMATVDSYDNVQWPSVYKLTKNLSGFTPTTYYASQTYNDVNNFDSCYSGAVIKSGGNIYTQMPFRNYFVNAVNPTGSPIRITVPGILEIRKIYKFNNGLVIHGQNNLSQDTFIRYNTGSGQFETALPYGGYSIGGVAVVSDGSIRFVGRRASDNVRILGTISPSNQLTFISQSLNSDVTQIISLN